MPSIPSFVSHVAEPKLLQKFMQFHSVTLTSEVLAGPAKSVAAAIKDAMCELAPGARGRLMQQIETIEKMSTEAGQTAIESVTLDDEMATLPSRHARAMWLLMTDPDRFRRASDVVYTDSHRYTRQWNSFVGPVGVSLSLDDESLDAFKQALLQAFDTENVHIDVYERTRPEFLDVIANDVDAATKLVQFTIYREGPPNAENAFVAGTLTTQIRRPVVEAAITYEPDTGTIECVAPQRESREEVVRAFGVKILGCAPDFEPCKARTYDLTVLRHRIDFPTDPLDGIEKVSVSLLRLHPVNTESERVTIEKISDTDRDIWSVVDERLGGSALKSDYRIGQARISISYRSAESNRVRTLPVTITHPHRSNIKEQSEIERVIASKYLPRWGLVAAS